MSAKFSSRDGAKPRKLRRMKAPLTDTIVLAASAPPRNPVVRALASLGSQGAGRHIRSHAAQRRADRVALQKAVQRDGLLRND